MFPVDRTFTISTVFCSVPGNHLETATVRNISTATTQHALILKLWDFVKDFMGPRFWGCDQEIALVCCPSQSACFKQAACCNSSKFNYLKLIESFEGVATCVTASYVSTTRLMYRNIERGNVAKIEVTRA